MAIYAVNSGRAKQGMTQEFRQAAIELARYLTESEDYPGTVEVAGNLRFGSDQLFWVERNESLADWDKGVEARAEMMRTDPQFQALWSTFMKTVDTGVPASGWEFYRILE